jgi:Flp pilus assembly protein TadD
MPTIPLIYFAFAHDSTNPLPNLEKEGQLLYELLLPRKQQRHVDLHRDEFLSIPVMARNLRTFKDQVVIFHYGGHAGSKALFLRDQEAHAAGIAELLSQQKHLKLVFLNGCSTQGQVDYLLELGVPAVIATACPINDSLATEFAEQLYDALVKDHTLKEAYDHAAAYMKSAGKAVACYRGIKLDRQVDATTWILRVADEAHYQWKLPEQVHADPGRPPHLLTLPPFIPEVFIGRENDLKALKDKLFKENNLLLLVNGEGGVGKTSLASQYFHTYQDQYAHVAWVLSQKSIALAMMELAAPLGVQFEDAQPLAARLDQLLTAMARLTKPCLLVIDNANELEDLAQNYQNLRRCANFHLLLTTRITKFQQAARYQIEGLPEAEALALFKTYYPRHQESEDALFGQIHTAVGGNTLVVELLAKNLALLNALKTNYRLPDLLTDLQSKGLLALSKSGEVGVDYQSKGGGMRQEKPEAIIEAMYDLSGLTEQEAALLSNFAVLPAERIPYDTLETLLPAMEALDQHLLSLSQKGWIGYDETARSFKCSPVVQEIARKKNPDLLNDCLPLIHSIVEKLHYEGTHLTGSTYEEAAVYARYAETITSTLKEPNNALAILCERAGTYHQITGHLEEALQFFEQYNQLKKELYEAYPNNVSFKNGLAISYSKLGSTHTALGHLDQALQFFEQFSDLVKELYEAYPNNVSFKNGLAISYNYLGNTYSALGHLDQALQFFEQFSDLMKELYEAYPNNVEFKNNLAVSYEKLGETHTALGHLEEALEYYEKDLQLTKELYEAYPNNVSFKNGLAISYEKLGSTHTELGHLDQALQFFEQRSQLGKELYEAYPNKVEFKNGLAISYSKLGETHTALGHLDQALQFFEQYNQLEKELYEAYPNNVEFKNNLAFSYEKLGETHTALGHLEEALQFFEQFSDLMKELYEAYPNNVSFKNGLAISYEKLGETHTALGHLDQALQFFEQRSQLGKELYEAYPNKVEFKNGLAISYSKLGETHTALGHLDQALQFFEQYNQLEKELYEAYPNNVEFKNNLAFSYEKLGETHTALGHLEEALQFFEQFSDLMKELYEAYPNNVSFKNGLAISYEKLGETHTALGHLEEALQFFEQFSDLMKELYEAYPNKVEFKNGLAISYEKLGSTHTALGHLDQALQFFEDETTLFEELYEAYPNNVSFKHGLAISYEKLGEMHTALGKLEEALEFFEQYNQLEKELYEAYPNNVSFKNGLAISYSKLGETHTALGKLEEALQFFEDETTLFEELYEAYPNKVSFKHGLAISYSKLGETHTALGKLEEALQFFEQYNQLEKELYEAYPNNVEFKNGLAFSYVRLATIYLVKNSRISIARDYLKQAETLFAELVCDAPGYVQFQQTLSIVQQILASLK